MDDKRNTRIIIVEDHPLYRMGLRMALTNRDSGFTILKEADNVKNAKEYVEQHADDIDLILLDYYLPDGTGLDVINSVKQCNPKTKILVISAENNLPDTAALVNTGINGFITKDMASLELPLIINSVMRGHDYFDSGLIEEIHSLGYSAYEELTQREIDIVRLSAHGLSAKQVAEQLNISPRTVEKHKGRIFSKLNINTTVELTNYAIKNGLV